MSLPILCKIIVLHLRITNPLHFHLSGSDSWALLVRQEINKVNTETSPRPQ